MSLINIVSENIISFKRIHSNICTGYRIIAMETINGEVKEYLLDEIDNPKVPQSVRESQELVYNEKQKWELPDDVVANGSSSVSVFINNVQITTNDYTYSPKLRLLNIHTEININDLIEVEYNVDRVTYTHKTQNICQYKVVPIYSKTHTIGQHTIL